jgi:hypothetical protein
MSALNPDKLHVTFAPGVAPSGPTEPRRYTLTHSDRTGDLFLTIGADYDRSQISGWYTRLMRDEVLAEWKKDLDAEPAILHVYCHVSGGLALGPAGWRYGILQRHMRQVIQALRHGDRELYQTHPELDDAQVVVHFAAKQPRYRRTEAWGRLADYALGASRQAA